jgi:serine protease Do
MNIEFYEELERYLEEKMGSEERKEFERRLDTNAELSAALESMRELRNRLAFYGKRVRLKHQMNLVHREMRQTQAMSRQVRAYKIQAWSKRLLPTIAVAASVAVVTVFSTLYLSNYLHSLERKQTSYYQQLVSEQKKGIERIRHELKAVSEAPLAPSARYTATGFVIAPNGYLVTNQHVIRKADSIYIESLITRKRFKVEVVYSDEALDLSVLRVTDPAFRGFGKLPYAISRRESDLGEPVYTLAYPRTDLVFGEGAISARSDYQGDTTKYQVSIPVNPGNSGSPVLDTYGNLVGIVSGKYTDAEGATSAIKSRFIYTVIDSLIRQGKEFPRLLPQQNLLRYYRRPNQIKQLEPFVYSVRVYDSK